jgi:hypothetical protein
MRNRVQQQQQSENAQDEPGLPLAEASKSWYYHSTVSTSASASPHKQQSEAFAAILATALLHISCAIADVH